MKKMEIILLASVSLVFAQSLRAANITYDFTSLGVSSTSGSGYSVGDFAWGGGDGAGNLSGSSENLFVNGNLDYSSQADALLNNHYFEFTVTPDAGQTISFQTLNIDAGGQAGSSRPTFNTSWFLRNSQDSFLNDMGAGIYNKTIVGGSGSMQLDNVAVTLTGDSDLQNVADATTFRFYYYSDSAFTEQRGRLDNVAVDFTVTPVPEPSLYAVLLGASVLLFAVKNRRSKHA